MSDSEDEPPAGERRDCEESDDNEPSTSWGLRKRRRQKKTLVSDDSEDEFLVGRPEIDEESADEEDTTQERLGEDMESGDSDSSSNAPGAETCAICLGRMRGEVGSPDPCEHTFCLICILEWAKTNPTCPQDRKPFDMVVSRKAFGGPIDKNIPIRKQEEKDPVILEVDNPTYCEVCSQCDREERLLLCDGCDLGYHLECLNPPLTQVPVEEWFCPDCISADIPSAVTSTEDSRMHSGSSRRGQSRPRTSSQQSRRPRLIPRTRATERIRARIVKHKREKRKKRKQNRKKKIESGEIDDPRPPVKHFQGLSFFLECDNDIDSKHTVDDFADQLLAGGSGHQIFRRQEDRKANAAKLLRDSVFMPQTTYAGKTPSAIINRINTQTEVREDDILSGILENQSIALSSSKNVTLTDDGKLAKQKEKDDDLCNMFQEENLIMSQPLPSRRPPSQNASETSEPEKKDRNTSPSSSTFHHRPYYSDSWRHSNYRPKSRSRSPYGRAQEDEVTSLQTHQSPLEDKRRSPPRMTFQRHFTPRYDRRERNSSNFHHRKSFDDHWYDKWPGEYEQTGYQRNSPYRKSYLRQIPLNETPVKHSDAESRSGNKGNLDRSHVELDQSRDSSSRRNDSPKRRHDSHSHKERRSPYRKDRTHERRDESQRWNHSSSRGYKSHDRRERDHSIHRSHKSGHHRSRSRSWSRSPSRSREHNGDKERKSRSHGSYTYSTCDEDGNVSIKRTIVSHNLRTVHNSDVPCMNSNSGSKMEAHVVDDDKAKSTKTEFECNFPLITEETTSRSSTSKNRDKDKNVELRFDHKNSDDYVGESKTDVHVPTGTDKLESCQAKFLVKGDKKEFFKPLENSLERDQSSSLNEEQVPRKRSQEFTMSSKENVNTSPFHSDDCKADTESNWSQDNWNSVGYHGKRAFDDSGSFVMKHKGRKRKMRTSLFGEEEVDVCSKDIEKHMTREEKEKIKGENTEKSSKNNSYTDLFGNDSEEEMVKSDSTPFTTLGSEKNSSKGIGETNSRTKKDVKIPVEAESNKEEHQKAKLNATDTVSNTLLIDKRIQEAKSLLILHSLFGNRKNNDTKAVKCRIESDKRVSEPSPLARDLVSGGKVRDDKHTSTKDENPKDKCKGNSANEISCKVRSKKSEADKLSSIHSEHPTMESGKIKKPSEHSDTKEDFKSKDSKAGIFKLDALSESSNSKIKSKDHLVSKEIGGKSKKGQNLISDLFGEILDIDSQPSSNSNMASVQEKKGKGFLESIDWEEQMKSFGKSLNENCSIKQANEKGKHTEEQTSKYQTYETGAKLKQRKDDRVDLIQKTVQESSNKSNHSKEETNEKEVPSYDPLESEAIAVASSSVKKAVTEDLKNVRIKQQKAALEVKVVEEVKKWLDPYYWEKSLTKDEYKEIVRKCVNKVVAAECGDVIESEKMRCLVEGYVKLFKHRKTKSQSSSVC